MTQNESYMKLSARWPAHVHLLVLSEAFVYLASSQAIVLLDKTTCVLERESNDEIHLHTYMMFIHCDGKLMLTSMTVSSPTASKVAPLNILLFTFPPSFTLLKKE